MSHLTEEQLTLAFYGDVDDEIRRHLDQCEQCQAAFAKEQRAMVELSGYPVPARGDSYGAEVWARLQPRLPAPRSRWQWLSWWTLTPALASLVLVAFFAGMLTERQKKPQGFTLSARDRVLLLTLGSHLDRSQVLLAELVNATPGTIDLAEERSLASDLLDENRLLRVTAARNGRASEAALLDELERVLLDVAHSPNQLSAQELEDFQRRLESESILFKVRIIRTNLLQEKRLRL